jgi:hypothetical protein
MKPRRETVGKAVSRCMRFERLSLNEGPEQEKCRFRIVGGGYRYFSLKTPE